MQKKWNDRPDGEMNKKDDANEVETSGEISNERRSRKNQKIGGGRRSFGYMKCRYVALAAGAGWR